MADLVFYYVNDDQGVASIQNRTGWNIGEVAQFAQHSGLSSLAKFIEAIETSSPRQAAMTAALNFRAYRHRLRPLAEMKWLC